MGVLLKMLPGVLIFMIGWHLVEMPRAVATVTSRNFMLLHNYEPPDQGGPDHSQSSGTR